MIGIYKITSPSGKVYIGQSIHIHIRFNQYKNKHCKLQKRLWYSFNHHGVENHIFEVIEECNKDSLNEREYYWQMYYDVLGENGLNCIITNPKEKTRVISKETRRKMSNAQLERKDNRKRGKENPNYGRKHSEETKRKIGDAQKGSLNHMYGKRGNLHHSYGKKRDLVHIDSSKKGLIEYFEKTEVYLRAKSIIVLDIYTGVYYYSISELSSLLNIDNSYVAKQLKNKKPNKFNQRYILTND